MRLASPGDGECGNNGGEGGEMPAGLGVVPQPLPFVPVPPAAQLTPGIPSDIAEKQAAG